MRNWVGETAALAVVSLVVVSWFPTRGLAQQTPVPTDNLASCYWQDALNGVFCDHTYSVRAGAESRALDWSSETVSPFRGRGSTTRHDSYRVSWLDAIGQFALTPYPWLKVSLDADFENLRDEDGYFFTKTGIIKKPKPGDAVVRGAYWGERTAEVNAKLYDSGPGDARYFAHVFAEIGIVPGQNDVGTQSRIGAGAETGARWALSSALALNARTVLSVDHFAEFGATALFPSARALLSFDAAGVALGPAYDGAALAATNGGVEGRRDANLFGAEALLQPFKTFDNVMLSGVILDAKAEHTVGPATFATAADASGATYSAAISFNFHY